MKSTDVFSTITFISLISMSSLLSLMVVVYFTTLMKEIKGYFTWRFTKNGTSAYKANIKQLKSRPRI